MTSFPETKRQFPYIQNDWQYHHIHKGYSEKASNRTVLFLIVGGILIYYCLVWLLTIIF